MKNKFKSDIPIFATFMFTLFLFVLFVFGIESIAYLLFKRSYKIDKYLMYLLVSIFALPNYLCVFKNRKFLFFFDRKLTNVVVILYSLSIFFISIIFILLGGTRVN